MHGIISDLEYNEEVKAVLQHN